jgi:IPT/TIG domain/FG-GAP-like repeat
MSRGVSGIDRAAAILRLLVACWCGLSVGGAVSSSAAQTMQYYGGPVIGQVKVVPVLWSSNVNPLVQQNATQFFQDAVNSPWLDLLSAYSTNFSGGTQQMIVPGTALSAVTLVPSKCATSATCTMADSDIQAELAAQIKAGHLPSPDSNTAYMIFMPPNVTWTNSSGGTSGSQFCSYNSTAGTTGGPPIIYGTIIDTFTGPGAGCGPNANALQNETALASTTLANAITDPDIGIASSIADPVAWFSTTMGQVGDACFKQDFTITVSGRTWSVNQIFNRFTNTCNSIAVPSVASISPAQGPVAGGTVVTITGSNFAIGSTVQFGSNHGINSIFISSTELTAFSPPGHGMVDVTVTNDAGTSATSAADQFTYRPASHDFNGDGYSDIAWGGGNGDYTLWLMNRAALSSTGVFVGLPSTWSIAGQRDFNGDGKADLLWRDTSGNTSIWFMNGTTATSVASIGNVPTPWTVIGVADFNGDGMGDLLWGDGNGDLAVWLMSGATVMSAAALGTVPTNWMIVGTGDFDGDGKADILWHDNLGNAAIWFMNGTTVVSAGGVGNVSMDWSVVGTGDFNGDGKSDIVWRDSAGDISIWLMNGAVVSTAGALGNVPNTWSIAQTGDYNGDGMSDLLWRDNLGNTAMWFINGTMVVSTGAVGNIPTNWMVQSTNSE